MRSLVLRTMLAGLVLVAITLSVAGEASAQCATCAVPTVAYQPVVAQPTVAYRPYTGWYPGKWLDQWRMRRSTVPASRAAYAPTYSAAYAPTYTAAYAPAYTTAYAPTYTAAYAPTYTAAYRPYLTSYAPLSAAVAAPCNTCTQTVARQVLMRPVVVAPACNTCSFTPSCGCDACSTGLSQAHFNEYSSEPACSSCAGGTVGHVVPPSYSNAPSAGAPIVGPPTGQPNYTNPVPAPADSRYKSNRPLEGSGNRARGNRDSDSPADGVDPLDEYDPGPATDVDPSTYYNAPRLLDPRDRTAARSYKKATRSYKKSHQPTVDVWTAVYRGPAKHRNISQASRRTRSQAEIDADGWTAVPRNR